jgi:hypothetical protein
MTVNPCNVAILEQVAITKFEAGQVSFATRSNQGKLQSYSTSIDHVLRSPPHQAPRPVKLQAGQVGNLYLDAEGWAAATAGGGIYGYKAGVSAAAQPNVIFKWPLCAPFIPVEALELEVSAIVLHDDHGKAHDLLGNDYADAQHLVWNAAEPISLATKNGSQQVWPTKLEITGKPSTGIANTIDVLDIEYADFNQMLSFNKQAHRVSPVLKSAGFGLFDAVMDSVRAVAEGHNTTYPGAIMKEWDRTEHPKLSPEHRAVVEKARAAVAKLPEEERTRGVR